MYINKLNESFSNRYLKEDEDLKPYKKFIIEDKDKQILDMLYNTSALTILGLVDNEENLQELYDYIKQYSNPIDKLPIYIIKGKVMNNIYNLTNDKAYNDDLTIIAISLADLNNIEPRIYRERADIKDSGWFDDIVESNKMVTNYGDLETNEEIINENFSTKLNTKKIG